jgi:hypothetical protein
MNGHGTTFLHGFRATPSVQSDRPSLNLGFGIEEVT